MYNNRYTYIHSIIFAGNLKFVVKIFLIVGKNYLIL